jgi:exo-beta-1,3-glucanase (GH17 family)
MRHLKSTSTNSIAVRERTAWFSDSRITRYSGNRHVSTGKLSLVAFLIAALVLLLLPMIQTKCYASPGDIVRRSISSSGQEGNIGSAWPSISSDGRYGNYANFYGLDFGPYTVGSPDKGDIVTPEQITRLMDTISPYTQWIRTYGTTNGLEKVPEIARGRGLKVACGCWLSGDTAANETQINGLIQLAQSGMVDLAVVGSETLLRNDLNEDQLIGYIQRVKATGVPTTTADTYDRLLGHPNVVAKCDLVFANIFPFWEGVPIKDAINSLDTSYKRLIQAFPGKEVIISETGWPSAGDSFMGAVPSFENEKYYMENFMSWTSINNAKYFYFEAFDEPWKAQNEGERGAHWGLWDKDGTYKFYDPVPTFYFAEGTCRPGFDPYFCIQNPGSSAANVTLTYMKGNGTKATDQVTLAPNSRATVSPRNKLGTGDDAAHDFSTEVRCTNGKQIIAERPMYFNYKGVWTGGHDVVGAVYPAPTFYFAEGTCRPGFDSYLCIQNPGGTDAKVHITYMKADNTTDTQDVTVGKTSRSTVRVKDKLGTGDDPAHDFSTKVECINGQTIIAERPMYFNYHGVWTGGSDVVGKTSPSSTYYFAEGTCRPNFDPYFCIQNPGNTAANVTLTYMKGDSTTATDQVTVPPNSRSTVSPRNNLGTGDDTAHDFSAKVECTNGQKIIAERPMYFNYKGVWTGGHDVVGAASPAISWYFAEGTTRPGFDPYLSIQNPWGDPAIVRITYMRGDGTTATQAINVGPHSRSTVTVSSVLGVGDDSSHDFSCNVFSTTGVSVVAERPMYFNYKGAWTGGSDVVGYMPYTP